MDSKIARKVAVSRWSLTLMVGLGIFASAIVLWRYQVAYQARQRSQAAEREIRLAALRAEAEAQRLQAERQMAKVKSAERVGQLYREIENLSHLSDQVESSLQPRPRMLKSSKAPFQKMP